VRIIVGFERGKGRVLSRWQILALLLAASFAGPRAWSEVHYQRLRSFGVRSPEAREPRAPLFQGSDGAFYGTATVGGTGYLGAVFKLRTDGSGYVNLHQFSGGPGDGARPQDSLTEGHDGLLYGTTPEGGSYGLGIVFSMSKDGNAYTILHHFGPDPTSGTNPRGTLLIGSDGMLYGTTLNGGAHAANDNQGGTVFKLNTDGSGYSVLHSFSANQNDGAYPSAGVIEGSDGLLYGTTEGGGKNPSAQWGTVFKLNRDGSGYTMLRSFGRSGGDGFDPMGPLVEGSDGMLYGTTQSGPVTSDGGTGNGSVFTLDKHGDHYRVLHILDPVNASDGIGPTGLIQGRDGALYGTAQGGGSAVEGAVFRLNPDGTGYTVFHSFFASTRSDGFGPFAPPVQARDGALYGTTAEGGANAVGTVFKVNPDGTEYQIVHSFDDTNHDGADPRGSLIVGSDGALYGITRDGGTQLGTYGRAGTLFKVSLDGNGYKILHEFGSTAGDGRVPGAGLARGNGGVLFGTTSDGGAYTNAVGFGGGTLFRVNEDGSGYSVLHSFKDLDAGGAYPEGPVTIGSNGVIYGSTTAGGALEDKYGNGGTIFKLNADGSGFATLHSFNFATEGFPMAQLLEGHDGVLYGATTGDRNVLFKLNKDGSGYTVLRPNIGAVTSGLLEGPEGALYGTAFGGGDTGALFRINKDGTGYKVLQSLPAAAPAGLVIGNDGAIYGTFTRDWDIPGGGVFKVNTDGSAFTVLYSFEIVQDGSEFQGGLVKGPDGSFYGSSSNGGELRLGMLFKIWPPQTPDLNNVAVVAGRAQVSFSGMSTNTYQLFRSTDLIHWTSMDTITMPASGISTNSDRLPLANHAFYRAAWVPQQ
jgi:uncharacterized repeat protein (TIGR03803 family)